MAFNGSGTHVRVHDWTTDLANTVAVTASRMDAEQDDASTALSLTICRDGQSTTSARIPFASGVSAAAGSTSSVSYAQTNDLNTGIYFPAADQFGLVAGGTEIITGTASGITITGTFTPSGQLISIAGTVGAPGVTFASDLDSGLYRIGANNIGVAVNGAKVLDIGTAGLGVTGTLTATGASTLAAISGTTGTFSSTLGVTGATTLAAVAATTGTFSGAVSATTGTFSGAISATNITGTGAINGATAAGAMVATQAQMETGTATDVVVTPGRQVFHQSAAKAWAKFNGTGTPALTASYNCSSITDGGTGIWTMNWTTAFSSGDYCVVGTHGSTDTGRMTAIGVFAQTTGGSAIRSRDLSGNASDENQLMIAAFGDR